MNSQLSGEISEIVKDKIYLTGLKGATNIDEIKKLGVNVIVSILNFNPMFDKKDMYGEIACIYYFAEDDDDFNIEQYFQSFQKIVEDPNNKILVHCYCGVSRSSTLVASYLIHNYVNTLKKRLLEKYNVDRILEIMKKRRTCVDPNDGFIKKLVDYRCELIFTKYAKLNNSTVE